MRLELPQRSRREPRGAGKRLLEAIPALKKWLLVAGFPSVAYSVNGASKPGVLPWTISLSTGLQHAFADQERTPYSQVQVLAFRDGGGPIA
jgi:hypothetical protein